MKRTSGYLIVVAIISILMCSILEAKNDCWREYDYEKGEWYTVCESHFINSKFKDCGKTMAFLEMQITFYETEFGDLLRRISELENTLVELETKAQTIKYSNRELAVRKSNLTSRTSTFNNEKQGLQDRERAIKFGIASLEEERQSCLASADSLEKSEVRHGVRIDDLKRLYAGYQSFFEYVAVFPENMNGLNGPHVVFEGVNVHIRSGAGETKDIHSGLGNLVIGYNENTAGALQTRTGAHNLIVGPAHSYSASGGFVAGLGNSIRGFHATVSGGSLNTAEGEASSVSGGAENTARGLASSISGGRGLTVEDDHSSAP